MTTTFRWMDIVLILRCFNWLVMQSLALTYVSVVLWGKVHSIQRFDLHFYLFCHLSRKFIENITYIIYKICICVKIFFNFIKSNKLLNIPTYSMCFGCPSPYLLFETFETKHFWGTLDIMYLENLHIDICIRMFFVWYKFFFKTVRRLSPGNWSSF